MKYVRFTLIAPDWVRFVCMNPNGTILGFEKKPIVSDEDGWIEQSGKLFVIAKGKPNPNHWRNTLEQIL